MKIALLTILVSTFTFLSSYGQREDRNWCFGDSVGVDFNNLSNPIAYSITTRNDEACASISDKNGNLLFYVTPFNNNGIQIFKGQIINQSLSMMENGDSIHLYYSATNGACIINMPGSDSLYYLFAIDIKQSPFQSVLEMYSNEIDISQNGGIGKVLNKNNFIGDSTTEKLCAVKHANGRDWWLITHSNWSNRFKIYLIDKQGIHEPIIQLIGSQLLNYAGEITSTKDGSKIGLIGYNNVIDLFDFDRCSGGLSNYIKLGDADTLSTNGGVYSCEFSIDGNRFYVGKQKYNPGYSEMDQYSVNSNNVQNSKVVLFDVPQTQFIMGQLQLAPDSKIYFSGWYGGGIDSSYKYLHSIDNPNDSGLACNVHFYSIYLNGHYAHGGLPNMPNYNLSALDGSECDSLGLSISELRNKKSEINIYPNPANEQLTVNSERVSVNTIEITNELGVTVTKLRQTKPEQQINIKSLSAGIYFIKVKTEDGSVTVRKFVKE